MSEQVESAKQDMQNSAIEADYSTHHQLMQLDEMAGGRRKDPALEARYEKLRDYLADQLGKTGPRYYIDNYGQKRYAYAVQPEKVEVNLVALTALYDDGKITLETFDRAAPRRVDQDRFKQEAAAGRITSAQLTKIAKFRKGTAHVRFSDPIQEE